MLYRVQVLLNDEWQFLTYPNATDWETALARFTYYMTTWIENDYRIKEVSR